MAKSAPSTFKNTPKGKQKASKSIIPPATKTKHIDAVQKLGNLRRKRKSEESRRQNEPLTKTDYAHLGKFMLSQINKHHCAQMQYLLADRVEPQIVHNAFYASLTKEALSRADPYTTRGLSAMAVFRRENKARIQAALEEKFPDKKISGSEVWSEAARQWRYHLSNPETGVVAKYEQAKEKIKDQKLLQKRLNCAMDESIEPDIESSDESSEEEPDDLLPLLTME